MNSAQLIEAYFGVKLSKDEKGIWTTELFSNSGGVNGLSEGELCNAIRWASDKRNWDRPRQRKVDLNDVKTWVYMFRKEKNTKLFGYGSLEDSDEARAAQAKKKLLGAKDHEERWEIICDDVRGPHESEKLYDWCVVRWGQGFEDDIDKLKRGMAAALRRIIASIGVDTGEEVMRERRRAARAFSEATGIREEARV